MKVKIKKLRDDAVIPSYSKEGDVGMDLTATSKDSVSDPYIEYGTGLSIEIPSGFVGLVFPRSSISKLDLRLCNSVAVVDSGFRGEWKCRFKVTDHMFPSTYEVGDRIAQLIILPYPEIEFEEVDELSDSERGTGGFGSTDE